jgi:glycosyltransferase involved in cell wall biosynthesis
MARELSRASLLVLLSEFETQPAAVYEGLALGRPALVAATSGLSELADRGLARAIPLASTPEQTGAAIVEAIRNPNVPPRELLPTWDECATRHLELYRTIASTHAARSGLPASRNGFRGLGHAQRR